MTIFPYRVLCNQSSARPTRLNEQFNLEQRKDLFSRGPVTVSRLQSMARLYLRLSQDHLSAAATTSPFMCFTFLISSPFLLALVEPRSFLKRVKLSLNHSLHSALPTIFYEPFGVFTSIETFLRGSRNNVSGCVSCPKKTQVSEPQLKASVREEMAGFQVS